MNTNPEVVIAMNDRNPRSVAAGAVLTIGILAVSTASIFVRYAQVEAPSLVIAAYRLTIASVVLVPLAWRSYRDELHSLESVDWCWAAVSGVFLALHFATWVTSLEYTSVASSVLLVSTSPLWVAIAGWLLLHERLTPSMIAGLVLALFGGVAVGLAEMQQFGGASLLGNALALTGAFTVTGYWLIGRQLRRRLSLVPYVAIVYGTAAVALLSMSVVARQPLTGYQPMIYLWFLLLGLVPQLIGHSSFNWALARLPATSVAVATLGEPVGSIVLAYFFLGETPTVFKLFGAGLILTGLALTLRAKSSAD